LLSDFFSPVESGAKSLSSPEVENIVAAFKEALNAQRSMLVIASRCKKPSEGDLQKVLKPTSDAMAKVDSLKDRRSKLFNHLAMMAEGVACLQWVCVEPTPAPFLGDVIPGSEMYGNKVIMEFKGKDEKHVNFAKDFKTFLVELQKYVKASHTTGLSWNPSGGTGNDAQLCQISQSVSALYLHLWTSSEVIFSAQTILPLQAALVRLLPARRQLPKEFLARHHHLLPAFSTTCQPAPNLPQEEAMPHFLPSWRPKAWLLHPA
jgi:hypothetical protein